MPKITKDQKITKDMTLAEVVSKYPQAALVMMTHGMHCLGCHAAANETIEQGCAAHGMSQAQIKEMLAEMNQIADKK